MMGRWEAGSSVGCSVGDKKLKKEKTKSEKYCTRDRKREIRERGREWCEV